MSGLASSSSSSSRINVVPTMAICPPKLNNNPDSLSQQAYSDEEDTRSAKAEEEYLLWLLSDSNLPTGGFVASSGLESYFAHGFLHRITTTTSSRGGVSSGSRQNGGGSSQTQQERLASATVDFVRWGLTSYARSAVPLMVRVHEIVSEHLERSISDRGTSSTQGREADHEQGYRQSREACLSSLVKLDEEYHTLALNHVLRRASKAQGMALLTLYTKSFAESPLRQDHTDPTDDGKDDSRRQQQRLRQARRLEASQLLSAYKRLIRKATSPTYIPSSTTDPRPHGHLPLMFSLLLSSLSISLPSMIKMHLFHQARSMLSSSVRLNTVGPYAAQGLLAWEVKDVLDEVEKDVLDSRRALAAQDGEEETAIHAGAPERSDSFAPDWNWSEDEDDDKRDRMHYEQSSAPVKKGKVPYRSSPVTTWPLGEILQARHDCLHSRLFNS